MSHVELICNYTSPHSLATRMGSQLWDFESTAPFMVQGWAISAFGFNAANSGDLSILWCLCMYAVERVEPLSLEFIELIPCHLFQGCGKTENRASILSCVTREENYPIATGHWMTQPSVFLRELLQKAILPWNKQKSIQCMTLALKIKDATSDF